MKSTGRGKNCPTSVPLGMATVTAGQILQDIDGKLAPGRDWRMEVTDEFQNTLYVLHIRAEQPK